MNGSRRESLSSLGNKQNDALFEFENFKKKFLLANKHITKLNSTLSVRIEELNAQISMLYVENLRLRASEIALASQLKREREQSRKILADAEAASQSLTKHLCYLRESLHTKRDSGAPPTPPSPMTRRPPLAINLDLIPPQFRIARPPNVPEIYEDEEPCSSSAGEHEQPTMPPRKKLKTKAKLSASKLPLPARGSSPTPPPAGEPSSTQRIDLSNTDAARKARKSIRRQSGLLRVNTESLPIVRAGSPAFGSPVRLEAGLAEAEEENAVIRAEVELLNVGSEVPVPEVIVVKRDKDKDKRKGKSKEQRNSESTNEASREKKLREVEDPPPELILKTKSSRTALQPIDSNVEEPVEAEAKSVAQRQFLRPPSPSRDTSSPTPEQIDETLSGREKRVRKSINYAEPKLNTKMRKPDPPSGTEPPPPRRKRSSAATANSSHRPSSSSSTVTDNTNEVIDDTEPPPQASLPSSTLTLPLKSVNGNYIDPEHFPIPPSRPGAAAALYSPGPPTRTTGSTTSSSSVTTAAAAATSSSSTSADTAITVVRRSKSRPQLILSDGDSDGADADAEYLRGGGGYGSSNSSGSNGWANVNMESGRRRGVPKRSAAAAAAVALEDMRRHSMVI